MEGYPEFYKLDKTKPVKVEGHVSKVSAFLIISIVMMAIIVGAFIYVCAVNALGGQSLMAVAFFICFCLAFLVVGIIQQKKYNKQNRAERELLKNCLCTDGLVYDCTSIERRHSVGDDDSYYYDVTVSYTFYNERNEQQYKTFKKVYKTDPEFYPGQWLMIAFNHNDSVILNTFTFVKEDEERFLKNQSARSDDDFDGLSGEIVKHSSKVVSLENNGFYIWIAVFLSVFLAIYAATIWISGAPFFFKNDKLIVVIIGYLLTFLVPAVLFIVIISLLCRYIKRRRRVKNILKDRHYFTWGKVFFSEKTFGNKTRKQVLYCYIDKWNKKHTEVLKVALKSYSNLPSEALIVYTADGRSVPVK